MSGLEKIEMNRERIRAVALRHGAGEVRMFGSVVRHEDGPDSDIDFLVHMKPGRDLLDLIALSQELEEILQQKTDVVSDEGISPHLKDRILRESTVV